MTKPILRFAPSPNGYLHLGHAYSAFFTWSRAKALNAEVLLRIEDIDTGRCRPEYVQQIYDDLTWLGLKWFETSQNPVRIQSQHFDDYRAATARLSQLGLLYKCFCTRKQVIAASNGQKDPDGAARYGLTCKNLSETDVQAQEKHGKAFALRLDMDKAIEHMHATGKANLLKECTKYANLHSWGDIVLVRKDTPTSYHLSVVVDDAKQNITHVTRGMDMFPSTAIHILLQSLLNLPTPKYEHHKLIKDPTGRKLAKSLRDRSIKAMREEGMSADAIKRQLGLVE